MSASRIKNLILLILLLAALCLLIAVVPTRAAQKRSEQACMEQLTALLARYEITADAEALPESATLYTLELAQSDGAAAAAALLGQNAVREESSTRYESRYTSPAGTVTLTRGGTLEAAVSGRKAAGNVEKDAQKVLRAMGFSSASVQTVRTGDGQYTVTAGQSLLGTEVFSEGLRLFYENNSLCALEGVFYPGTEQLTRISERSCIGCADALVQLLACRNELGWVGSKILRARQGFLPAESASGAMRFVPCWCIETDTDTFYVNGISREVRSIDAG